MKKNLLIAVLVLINALVIAGGIKNNNVAQSKIDKMTEEYNNLVYEHNQLVNDYNSVNDELDELEDQVYRAMNGKNYEFTIDHDDESITYIKKGKGSFREELVMTVR